MLSFDDIKQLITLIDDSNLNEFELDQEGTKLSIKKNNEVVSFLPSETEQVASPEIAKQVAVVEHVETPIVTEAPSNGSDLEVITSPMVGTFYASGSPGEPPFVEIGSQVSNNTVVCVVEAMKLFNEITADLNGEIAEILVSNGELVEFGQPLFKVRKK
ncbi:acetyl-CoA carboxylase biotin carboxyl carrier protein [Listeria fleischmannii]|jgi:acetyl-CoA carboxylase biotin carboxyl carrier protein|uniref:Biotin carboxyl carrier protein of acetyl-CoA carboxylase n=2 Tax=Listeria fleischmannii TaxID=1069827 RepID=W7DIB6_9LIST|nr:acetyl-CoA carboxylase biotin carboxyl carrier protein [Listeria fleischmannii]EIA21275.1 acetyl-CoA carboxylase biotin carboxyl carrier family protein [Listeria fleischmannii subsp. coloradonensis]EUJ64380.1 putative acetyl-CoA carboxylase subunit (biotin carboxyl carrier subunit) [Listeria fleischmannii FSL S10-1203]MBC1399713.1 acetyl-CoA carboxylase biotin carboxyl carrier protein [Listeria fleischmannii]MBC1419747.1 acetyl-CoA carboxylase biotin carboxyl carrier protein [Listeria fleisc